MCNLPSLISSLSPPAVKVPVKTIFGVYCVISTNPPVPAIFGPEEGLSDNIVTTVEAGTFGGTSLGGGSFGTAIAPQATIAFQDYQLELHNLPKLLEHELP